jgi:hypothetical protein
VGVQDIESETGHSEQANSAGHRSVELGFVVGIFADISHNLPLLENRSLELLRIGVCKPLRDGFNLVDPSVNDDRLLLHIFMFDELSFPAGSNDHIRVFGQTFEPFGKQVAGSDSGIIRIAREHFHQRISH